MCPDDITSVEALNRFKTLFPSTKLVIFIQNPVVLFQEMYNDLAYHKHPNKLPSPNELVGSCANKRCGGYTRGCGDTESICTDRMKLHHQLSHFGKTPMSVDEKKLLRVDVRTIPTRNEILLFEHQQVFGEKAFSQNATKDLSTFLRLKHSLPEVHHAIRPQELYQEKQKRTHFINICDDEHKKARDILLRIAHEASIWICDYFINSTDVTVSSREVFTDLVEEWRSDPCVDGFLS
uniref:Uncharacterized protein n=1 Tax=Trieres chinensis TaxID=1514140 RepID=A0A7S1Z588_TRICV|mmetsp:Transcript_18055/g.36642  ORF Transcript_18055/g.36642 Transcript_18055/m.36642 type:complete len:236 (+) Transcript_18055:551-1258(+)